MVVWLVFWMWKHGRTMKQDTERRLGELVGGPRFGIFLFTFLMVLREGVETVLMLLAVDFTSASVLEAAGASAGLVAAIALGIAFYKGTLRVDLRKFFSVTSILLLIFAFQLLVSGFHEFAESGDLPSGETYMRVAGPLMKHSAIFVIAALVLPFALLFRRSGAPAAPSANPAEDRKERARERGERIAKASFAALAAVTIIAVGAHYAYTATGLELTPPEMCEARPGIDIPFGRLEDGKLHRFGVNVDGKLLRFLVMKKKDGYGTAMDACTICGDKGYVQRGDRIICLNCVAEINAPTLGEGGGCNPIPVPHQVGNLEVLLRLEDLKVNASYFRSGVRFEVTCAGCGMKFDLAEAAGRDDQGRPYCRMPGCAPKAGGKR
jgi:uncharacterized membrane protein